MKKMIEQAVAGEHGAADVLLDYLLDVGVEHTVATSSVNDMLLGPNTVGAPQGVDMYTIQPSTIYDTVVAQGPASTPVSFFRDLQDKYNGETSLHQPRRIDSFTAFRARRVSLEALGPNFLPPNTYITAHIGRFKYLNCPTDWLMKRGIWGQPLLLDISDQDDLHGEVHLGDAMGLQTTTLRLTLHGWKSEQLGI